MFVLLLHAELDGDFDVTYHRLWVFVYNLDIFRQVGKVKGGHFMFSALSVFILQKYFMNMMDGDKLQSVCMALMCQTAVHLPQLIDYSFDFSRRIL